MDSSGTATRPPEGIVTTLLTWFPPACNIDFNHRQSNTKTSNSMKKFLLALGLVMAFARVSLAVDVKENWEKNCQKCHGADGKGQTRMGRQSGAKDYTDPKVQAELKDEDAIKAIKEGIVEKGKKKMHAYGDKLTDDEIK